MTNNVLLKQLLEEQNSISFENKSEDYIRGYRDAEFNIFQLVNKYVGLVDLGYTFIEEGCPKEDSICFINCESKCRDNSISGIAFYSAKTKCFYWLPGNEDKYEKVTYKVLNYLIYKYKLNVRPIKESELI